MTGNQVYKRDDFRWNIGGRPVKRGDDTWLDAARESSLGFCGDPGFDIGDLGFD